MTLKKAMEGIDKQFGPEALSYFGENGGGPVEAISTGSYTLDRALGIGGVPRGRMVEIYGPASAGKSTLVCHIMANAEKCALVDTEHSFDADYAARIGMDVPNLLFSQPDYGEQGMEIVARLVESGELDVIAVDSLAALVPRAELEGEMGDAHVGLQARLMSQGLRKLTPLLSKTKTALIFTNQIRESVGTMGFGPVETQPGGRALKFYAAQRMDIRRIETLKTGTEPTGIRCRVKIVKNKTASPGSPAEFIIRYGEGISNEETLIDMGLDAGLIERSGGYYSLGDHKVQGREKLRALLAEDREALDNLSRALSTPKEVEGRGEDDE